MPPAPRRTAALAFFLAAALSLVAGALPWLRGRDPNASMLVLAVVWSVFGVLTLRRGSGGDDAGAGRPG